MGGCSASLNLPEAEYARRVGALRHRGILRAVDNLIGAFDIVVAFQLGHRHAQSSSMAILDILLRWCRSTNVARLREYQMEKSAISLPMRGQNMLQTI